MLVSDNLFNLIQRTLVSDDLFNSGGSKTATPIMVNGWRWRWMICSLIPFKECNNDDEWCSWFDDGWSVHHSVQRTQKTTNEVIECHCHGWVMICSVQRTQQQQWMNGVRECHRHGYEWWWLVQFNGRNNNNNNNSEWRCIGKCHLSVLFGFVWQNVGCKSSRLFFSQKRKSHSSSLAAIDSRARRADRLDWGVTRPGVPCCQGLINR